MRSLEAVKKKRDELKAELEKFIQAKHDSKKAHWGLPQADLSALEKAEYIYIMRSIYELRNQINCLDFVLNEDTEMNDATRPVPSQVAIGIKKENVLNS